MRHPEREFSAFVFLLVLLFGGATLAQDEKKDNEKKPDKEQSKKVTLTGTFEAIKSTEVTFDTKQVASAKIKKITANGSMVEKGDLLVSFEREDYKEQLEKAQRKMASSVLARKEAEFKQEQFEQTQKLDREAAKRAWQSAQDEYSGYLEFDRQYSIDSAKFSLKQSRQSIEYLEEDLRQLERMYEEDELTEESEELVLTRARRSLESAKFRLKNTEVRSERTLKQRLPREAESKKETHTRAKLTHEKAMAELEFARKKKQLEKDAADIAFKDEQEDLDELTADGEKLVLSAPTRGMVIYGELKRGQMSDKAAAMDKGTSVSKEQTVLTIVDPKRVQIRSSIPEKEIAKLKVGMRGTAKSTANPDREFNVVIKSIGQLPYSKGKYDCVLSIKGKSPDIMPTMTCSVEFEMPTSKEKSDGEQPKKKQKKKKKTKRNSDDDDDDDENDEKE